MSPLITSPTLLKFCIGYGVELSRVISFISYHWKRKFRVQTEWEKRESRAPEAFTYNQSIPNDTLILTLAMCYAVIVPMLLVFAFLYFILGWTVQCNQTRRAMRASGHPQPQNGSTARITDHSNCLLCSEIVQVHAHPLDPPIPDNHFPPSLEEGVQAIDRPSVSFHGHLRDQSAANPERHRARLHSHLHTRGSTGN